VTPPPLDPLPGFWIRLVETDARALARGELPPTVRADVATMLKDYDTHLANGQAALDAKQGLTRARALHRRGVR
jgi:hypothetical protein